MLSGAARYRYVFTHTSNNGDDDAGQLCAIHGLNTQHAFHVPALVWYLDSYQMRHPDKIAQLIRRNNVRPATENVFLSLLNMADIRYRTEQLERSFLNKKFKPHKRYVDSYCWTDYDLASFKDDCRIVVAKG